MQTGAEIFNQVLLQGEQVIKTFRPNQKRFWLSRLSHIVGLIPFMAFPIILLCVHIFLGFGPSEPGFRNSILTFPGPIFLALVIAIPVLFIVLEIVVGIFWYKNRLYCFTNKRVMIQCGIFGRNFRFMDLMWATNSFVHISPLDRMMGKNTGSIKFSAMGNPMMNTAQMGSMGGPNMMGGVFYFLYVENPHDILREIQEQASAMQSNSANQMANLANQMGNLANAFGSQNNNMGGGFNNQQGNMTSGFNQNQGGVPNGFASQQEFEQFKQFQQFQQQQQQANNQQQPQQPSVDNTNNNNGGWGNNDGGGGW